MAVAADAGVPVVANVQTIASLDEYNYGWMAAAHVPFYSHETLPYSPEE